MSIVSNLKKKYLGGENYTTSTIYLVLGGSLTAVTFLLIDIALTRTVPVKVVGEWKQIILLVQLFIPIFYLGIPEGFKYLLAKNPKRQNYLLATCLSLTIVITSIIVILNLFGFWGWILNILGNNNSYESLLLFPFIYFSIIVYTILQYITINNYKTPLFFKSVVLSSFFQLSLIGTVFLFYKNTIFIQKNISWIFILIILGNYFLRIIVLQKGVNINFNLFKFNKRIIAKIFSFGIPLYLASYIGILTLNIDKVIISKYGGLSEFAIYSIGAFEIPLIGIISVSLAKSMFPKLVELVNTNKELNAKALWTQTTLKLSYITYPIIIFLLILSEPIILYLFGETYSSAVPVFRAYLLILIWRNNAYGAILQAKGKTKSIMLFSITSLALNAILSYFLYVEIGIIGVVYATFIAVMISNLLQLIYEKMFVLYLKNVVFKPFYLVLISTIFLVYIYI